jgi:predicted DNA-binding transcriptional regulator AlpA
MDTTQRLLTDSEAADILQMPSARLARFAKENEVPHLRLPDGEIRFDLDDLRQWVETLKQPAAAVAGEGKQ